MSCHLYVTGVDFAVDDFLKDSDFVPQLVYRKGKRLGKSAKMKKSGIIVTVGGEGYDEKKGLIYNVTAFIKKNQPELKRLREFPNVENMYFTFDLHKREEIIQTDLIPSNLLFLIGRLKIDLQIVIFPAPTKEGASESSAH